MMGQRMNENLNRLEGIIRLLEHIKYEIGELMTPQNEIFIRFGNEALEKCGFLEILKKCRADGEGSLLEKALDVYGKPFLDDQRCDMMLRDFASSLGKLSREAQVERCTAYITRFGEIYAAKNGKTAGDVKLCRSMGILIGAASVIILL